MLRNYFTYVFPWMKKKTRARNTAAYLAMMDKYDLKMMPILGISAPLMWTAVGKKAAEKGDNLRDQSPAQPPQCPGA